MSTGRANWRIVLLAGIPSWCFAVFCFACLCFSACSVNDVSDQETQESLKISSPPDIPEPPLSIGDETDPNSPQGRLVYQDVIEFEQQLLTMKPDEDNASIFEKQKFMQSQGFAFVHAVQEGVRKQVLVPPPYDSEKPVYFEPQVPVVYREFYNWMLGFGDARQLSGATPGSVQTGFEGRSPTLSEEGWTLDTSPESVSESDALARFGISMPLEAGDEAVAIVPDDHITREMLCYLYARLSRQQNRVKAISPQAAELSSSGKSKLYALQAFQDRAQISPWAVKYVALAYQDGLLKNVFGLRPTALVNGQGLQPKKLMTRAEAITFLYQFFSTHELKPQQRPVDPEPEEAGDVTEPPAETP